MRLTLEESALKLHVDEHGFVWFLDGDRLPARTELSPQQFLDHPACRKADRVRLVGNAANAWLIVNLYARKLRNELNHVEVCSPLVSRTNAQRRNPEQALFDMRSWDWSPSQGGWHEVTDIDYPSYALCLSLRNSEETASHFLRAHPAWPALSFIGNGCHKSFCELLALVLDPRWYIDLDHPDRSAKLESFLGITVAAQRVVSQTGEAFGTVVDRNRLVLNCWKSKAPRESELGDPGFFLWRLRNFIGGWKGDLRASQFFVRYLRYAWLEAVYAANHWMEPLFEPSHFFATADEAEAYRFHVRRLLKR